MSTDYTAFASKQKVLKRIRRRRRNKLLFKKNNTTRKYTSGYRINNFVSIYGDKLGAEWTFKRYKQTIGSILNLEVSGEMGRTKASKQLKGEKRVWKCHGIKINLQSTFS